MYMHSLWYGYLLFADEPEFTADRATTFNCSEPTASYIPCASYPSRDGALLCRAVGNPVPTVDSTPEDDVADSTNVDVSTESEIRISSVVAGNAGYYNCVARSSVGNETRRFRFYVGGWLTYTNVDQSF